MWENKPLPSNPEIIANTAFYLAQNESKTVFSENDYLYPFTNDSNLIPSQLSFFFELDLVKSLLLEILFDGKPSYNLESKDLAGSLKLLKYRLDSTNFDDLNQAISESNFIKIPNKDELDRLNQKIEISTINNYNKDDFRSLEELIKTEPLLSFNYQLNNPSKVSLLHYLLIQNYLKNTRICHNEDYPSNSNGEYGENFPYLSMPKRIPTIELGIINDGLERENIGVLNQTINCGEEEMPIPMIYQYHLESFYQLGESLQTVLITNVKNIGMVYYKYIMYVFESNKNVPLLIISAETNPMLIEDLSNSLFIGIFFAGGRRNLGLHENLNSTEEFVSVAHDIVRQAITLNDNSEFSAIDIEEQQTYLEEKLKYASDCIVHHNYKHAYLLLHSLIFKLRDSAYINYFSKSLLYISICCIELAKYDEAIIYIEEGISIEMNRGKPDNLANFLCELGKTAYLKRNFVQAKSLCKQALDIKVTVFPRIVQSGLATSRKLLNSEIENELYLIALVSLQQNDLDDSEKLLNFLRATCERKFHAKMLGKMFDMLSIIAFRRTNYEESITLLASSLKTKYEAKDYVGIIISSAILQLFFLKKGSEIPINLVREKLHFKERTWN